MGGENLPLSLHSLKCTFKRAFGCHPMWNPINKFVRKRVWAECQKKGSGSDHLDSEFMSEMRFEWGTFGILASRVPLWQLCFSAVLCCLFGFFYFGDDFCFVGIWLACLKSEKWDFKKFNYYFLSKSRQKQEGNSWLGAIRGCSEACRCQCLYRKRRLGKWENSEGGASRVEGLHQLLFKNKAGKFDQVKEGLGGGGTFQIHFGLERTISESNRRNGSCTVIQTWRMCRRISRDTSWVKVGSLL